MRSLWLFLWYIVIVQSLCFLCYHSTMHTFVASNVNIQFLCVSQCSLLQYCSVSAVGRTVTKCSRKQKGLSEGKLMSGAICILFCFFSNSTYDMNMHVCLDILQLFCFSIFQMSVLPSVQPFHAIAYPLDPMLALEIRYN